MLANTSLISCNFSRLPLEVNPKPKIQSTFFFSITTRSKSLNFPRLLKPQHIPNNEKKGVLQTCRSFSNSDKDDQVLDTVDGSKESGRDWTTSILLFVMWGGLMYYVFNLAPDQTPSRDKYFLDKLLNLKADDGFRMNSVLVSLWYIMGLWPLVYSMLLLPTGRSSKTNIPVWPFLVLSCFGGAYALIPYFILWRPLSPPVEENELGRWPLNFLESKLTARILLAAGLAILLYAGLNGNDWKEFYQYFRESKFIHVACLDFTLLSAFGPFWVYNDMTARKWYEKGSWLLFASLIPFLGPALYVVLRPPLSTKPISASPISSEEE